MQPQAQLNLRNLLLRLNFQKCNLMHSSLARILL
jgi:hypothetical protein